MSSSGDSAAQALYATVQLFEPARVSSGLKRPPTSTAVDMLGSARSHGLILLMSLHYNEKQRHC